NSLPEGRPFAALLADRTHRVAGCAGITGHEASAAKGTGGMKSRSAEPVDREVHTVGSAPIDPSQSKVTPDGVIFKPASSIRPEPVRWAWRDRVPLGMLTLLVGVP